MRGTARPADGERASVGLFRAAHDPDQRRFAGAVLADQRVDLARVQIRTKRRGSAWTSPNDLEMEDAEKTSGHGDWMRMREP